MSSSVHPLTCACGGSGYVERGPSGATYSYPCYTSDTLNCPHGLTVWQCPNECWNAALCRLTAAEALTQATLSPPSSDLPPGDGRHSVTGGHNNPNPQWCSCRQGECELNPPRRPFDENENNSHRLSGFRGYMS